MIRLALGAAIVALSFIGIVYLAGAAPVPAWLGVTGCVTLLVAGVALAWRVIVRRRV